MRTETSRPPEVPLEAGIGPANPPCPVCGEPLFGWTTSEGRVVRRCEACSLGVVGDPGDAAEALAALEQLRAGGASDGPRYLIANRASLAASLGGGGWAAFEPGTRFLFSAESVRRLAADRDQVPASTRWRAGRSIALMWGTLLNSFTFGRNVALSAFGLTAASRAQRSWQRGLDAFITAVTALPLLLVAALLESGAALAGRGGVLELTLRLD